MPTKIEMGRQQRDSNPSVHLAESSPSFQLKVKLSIANVPPLICLFFRDFPSCRRAKRTNGKKGRKPAL